MKKMNAIPAVIMLTAGVITCFISIKKRYQALDMLLLLLVVLILFYLLGLVARGIISSIVKKMELAEAQRLEEERLLKEQQEEQERLEQEAVLNEANPAEEMTEDLPDEML